MAPSALRRIAVAASVTAAAAVLAVAPAVSASAHDYLVSSTPADGSTQSEKLDQVVLTFNDRVLDLSGDGSSNVVEVTSSAGRHFESGCPAIADTDVTVPVALGDSGRYTVTWQVVSADGHTVSDSIGFTYDRPADVDAAAGRASRPTCGDQPTSGVGASASSSGAEEGAGTSALPVALGVGGGIILVALIAVVVVLTRSRKGPAGGPPAQ